MPAQDIKQYLTGRKIDLAQLAAMKPEWRVAMQAILMRAKTLKLIERNQEEYLWKQIGIRRMKVREPAELDFDIEQPSVMPNLLSVFRSTLHYSSADISKLFHLYEFDLDDIYGTEIAQATPPRQRPRLTVVG